MNIRPFESLTKEEREQFEDWLYLGQTEVEPDDLNKSEINLAWLAWQARQVYTWGNSNEPSANHKIKKGDMRVIDGILMTCTDPEIGRWQGSAHEPTDTEMLDWIERVACKDVDKYGDDSYWVDNFGSNLILEGFRETISKAMGSE
jgi:hypothetical protein